jgi:RNase adaptor protein for sRNA GlmZ degradation
MALIVYLVSFGHKYLNKNEEFDANMVIDVRKVHNNNSKYKMDPENPNGGLDKRNRRNFMKNQEIKDYYNEKILIPIREYLDKKYKQIDDDIFKHIDEDSMESLMEYTVAIGCHEGIHRSVAFIEQLYLDLYNDDRFIISKEHLSLY